MANQREIYLLGRRLLNEHGLNSWHFGFDSAKARVGQTQWSTKSITVSRNYVELNTVERIRMTIIHEIAHALVGPGHGHDAVWKAMARSLGHSGERITAAAEGVVTVSPVAPWTGTCDYCHTSFRRHRLTAKTRNGVCPKIHVGTHHITWRRTRS